MMFDNQAVNGTYRTGVALHGALRGAPSDAVYELRIQGIGYGDGTVPAHSESSFFRIVPEPAGALLLAVAAANICSRGRRS